jgi:outer membrane receptor protein involved in Fe transport
MFLRSRYQFIRTTNDVTPAFSNCHERVGPGRHPGNDQTRELGAADAGVHDHRRPRHRAVRRQHNLTNGGGVGNFLVPGRHSLTMGGNLRRQEFDIFSQQNARGNFGFTGPCTGSDIGDFLLGMPQTSAIAFGNADKAFRQNVIERYFNDDYRVSPVLTLNLGVRWEYESPITEAQGRLVNSRCGAGFHERSPVVADDALLQSDRSGIQPRVSLAWRPIPGSSLVVRASYGIYRNQNVYRRSPR